MLTVSEIIVLLWLAPVAVNIILPLTVLFCWTIGRPFHQASQTVSTAKAETPFTEGQRMVSAAGT